MEPAFQELYVFLLMVVDEADLKLVMRDSFLEMGQCRIWKKSLGPEARSWTESAGPLAVLASLGCADPERCPLLRWRHKNGTHMVKNRAVEIQLSDH